MIVILFIVLLIIFLLYIYFKSKNHFQVNHIIKGSSINDEILKLDNDDNTDGGNIYLGKSIEQTYLTYDTQFKFKLSSIEKRYEISNGTAQSQSEEEDDTKIILQKEGTMENNEYVNLLIYITDGKGKGQLRKIISNIYIEIVTELGDILIKTVHVDNPWTDIPDNTSKYSIFNFTLS